MSNGYTEIGPDVRHAARVRVGASPEGNACLVLMDQLGVPFALAAFPPDVARVVAREMLEAADIAEAETAVKQ